MRIVFLILAVAPLVVQAQGDASGCRQRYRAELEAKPSSSLVHFQIGECLFDLKDFQAAANEFREALSGDQEPKWTDVWSHINLGKIFDKSGQRDRALHEYKLAQRTHDDTRGAQAEAAKYIESPYTGR